MVYPVMTLEPGEPHAGRSNAVSLADLVAVLTAAPPALGGKPWIVGIDGAGGTGESTLTERLQAQVPRDRCH